MRALDELIDTNEPGWALIEEWLKEAKNDYEILPRDESRAQSELLGLQVTTRSPMGALVYGCGGVVIDGGWLRVLGSGCEQMKRGIYSFNLGKSFSQAGQMPSYLLVADDVLGGFFAVNGGAFGGKAGNVFYYAPDSGKWEDTQLGYSQFLYWALCGDISKFYELYCWDGWREDVRNFSLDKVMFALPPLLWQDADVRLRLKDMKKDGVNIDEYFASLFKGEK
ncbi:DUF2625 family protein [Campylobacter concisus]|uniref:DUF2625 family protein n=1 Tax=Campylobacter concisus TaxID=199 RepID=UPI000CD86F36|nr:DUF2625 family protein [Campylobacter concisus]